MVTAVADAREAVDSGISSAWSNELAMELESLEECEVLLDESWITTFDSMPQPHCLVVGEEHSFQFWNKGFETAIVDWPGGGRSLSSDSQFETGRIGDVLPAGKHEVAVDPYGDVVLYVMPRSASLLAQVDLGTLNEDGLRGMPVRDLAGLLGLDLVIRTATETCFVAVVRGDPYSPEFVLVGDGTVAGSFFVGLTAHTYGCA